MRVLRIYAGPNPQQLEPLGNPTRVESETFVGDISVFIKPNEVVSEKNFSIQVVGRYLPIDRLWSFEDVMFGVELDRPVSWSSVPLPNWLAKSIYRWIKKMNSEIEIRNLFVNDKQQSVIELQDLFGDYNSRPSILTPIVCGATTMNAYPVSDDVAGQYLRTAVHEYAQYIGMENALKRRRLEWNILSTPHSVWMTGFHEARVHQFPRELVEFNQFVFGPMNIPGQRSPLERRDFLREKTHQHQHQHHHHHHHHGHHHGHSHKHQKPPGHLRKQFVFDPLLVYAFEFNAGYFDFLNFQLRPKIAHGVPKTFQNYLSGRFTIDTAPYTVVRNDGRERASRVVVSCKCRSSGVYFWTTVFELVDLY